MEKSMQKNTISPEVLAGATALLMPYFQGLTAESLVQKLKTEAITKEKAEAYITKREYAKVRGCSVMTVHRLIQDGKIPAIRISKRLIRIPSSALAVDMNGGANVN